MVTAEAPAGRSGDAPPGSLPAPPAGGNQRQQECNPKYHSASHVTLRLLRSPSKHHITFGTLFVDEVMECLTLEDEIRERPGVPVSAWKIPGQTAIPAGRYLISLTMSARFGRVLPLLHDVPGFSGIRIHTGNVIDETDGCILVGRRASGLKIAESRIAFRKLMTMLERAADRGDALAIEISNP